MNSSSFYPFKFLINLLLIFFGSKSISAQIGPDVLYYRFDSKSKTNKIANLASNPPKGADSALLIGKVTIGDTGLCGKALVGVGSAASTDYLDTKWSTVLSGSWTFAMWVKKIPPVTNIMYFFGDIGAGTLRCFTNGVAGTGNWLLRGPFSDLLITGGANMKPNHLTFVYNDTTKELKGFLNGVLNNKVVLTASPNVTSTSTLSVGAYGTTSIGLPKGGLVDNFMVYSRAISDSEVVDIMSGSQIRHVELTVCSPMLSPDKKKTYSKSGTYVDTLKNTSTCDSIIVTKLTVNSPTYDSMKVVVCYRYRSPSKKYFYTKTGIYYDTVVGTNKCDKYIKIDLTVNQAQTAYVSHTVCERYVSPTNKIYIGTGIYADTVKTVNGCDSFIITDLTVHEPTKSNAKIKICESYISPMGKRYTLSGRYYDTILNSHGCDSVIVTELTILEPNSYKQNIVTCDSFISSTGNVYKVSGVYQDLVKNSAGCDSTIITNLTINHSFFEAKTIRVCGGYRSPKGNWITQSGMYYDSLTTVNGCDSIYSLDVTIDTVNVGVTVDNNIISAIQQGASYQWLDCGNGYAPVINENSISFAPTLDGNYSVELKLNTCKDTSVCIEVINLDVTNLQYSQVNVQPNPTKGEVLITHDQSNIERVAVLNANGQTVIENNQVQSKSVSVDMSSLPNGVYFIEVNSIGQSSKHKVIKSN